MEENQAEAGRPAALFDVYTTVVDYGMTGEVKLLFFCEFSCRMSEIIGNQKDRSKKSISFLTCFSIRKERKKIIPFRCYIGNKCLHVVFGKNKNEKMMAETFSFYGCAAKQGWEVELWMSSRSTA